MQIQYKIGGNMAIADIIKYEGDNSTTTADGEQVCTCGRIKRASQMESLSVAVCFSATSLRKLSLRTRHIWCVLFCRLGGKSLSFVKHPLFSQLNHRYTHLYHPLIDNVPYNVVYFGQVFLRSI